MERNFVREPRSEIGDTQLMDKKSGKLVTFGRKRKGFLVELRPGEHLKVKHLHHRPTRTTGNDHSLRALELFENFDRHLAAFVPIAGVERGLAAACQALWALDFVP